MNQDRQLDFLDAPPPIQPVTVDGPSLASFIMTVEARGCYVAMLHVTGPARYRVTLTRVTGRGGMARNLFFWQPRGKRIVATESFYERGQNSRKRPALSLKNPVAKS